MMARLVHERVVLLIPVHVPHSVSGPGSTSSTTCSIPRNLHYSQWIENRPKETNTMPTASQPQFNRLQREFSLSFGSPSHCRQCSGPHKHRKLRTIRSRRRMCRPLLTQQPLHQQLTRMGLFKLPFHLYYIASTS